MHSLKWMTNCWFKQSKLPSNDITGLFYTQLPISIKILFGINMYNCVHVCNCLWDQSNSGEATHMSQFVCKLTRGRTKAKTRESIKKKKKGWLWKTQGLAVNWAVSKFHGLWCFPVILILWRKAKPCSSTVFCFNLS